MASVNAAAGGYTNVTWVGARKALPHQRNGKSPNINHMVRRKMYPDVKETSQVWPLKRPPGHTTQAGPPLPHTAETKTIRLCHEVGVSAVRSTYVIEVEDVQPTPCAVLA